MSHTTPEDYLTYTPPSEACEGLGAAGGLWKEYSGPRPVLSHGYHPSHRTGTREATVLGPTTEITVDDLCRKLALSPLPSGPLGKPLPRTPASAGRSPAECALVGHSPVECPLVGHSLVERALAVRSLAERSTGLAEPAGRAEPEASRGGAPDALMAGAPCPGCWERRSWLVASRTHESVGWGRAESPAPALA